MPARPNFDLLEMQKSAPDRPQDKSAVEPSVIYFDNMKSLQDLLVTDTNGALCANLPTGTQIPSLEGGGDHKGCNYTDAEHDPLTYEIYKDHKDQTVKLYGDAPNNELYEGSGVMVGKNGDQCQILTALHVIEGDTIGESLPNLHLATTDGSQFPAQIANIDRPHELAVVSVNMGTSADALCQPVTIAKDSTLSPFDDAISLGYPNASISVYASPSVSLGTRKLRDTHGETSSPSDYWTGEDPERPVLELEGLALHGDSGGPTFNKDGNLIGVVDESTSNYTIWSTPVTTEMIDDLMR